MTFTRAVEFYKKYVGLMSDEEIFAETGYSADRIRKQIIKRNGQLCWTCKNACDLYKCEFVRNCLGFSKDVKYPDYVKTVQIHTYKGDLNYITDCERYEHDGRSK